MITALNSAHPLRPSMALKVAVQQMKPWQFGIYGMPLSVERKYSNKNKEENNSYTINKIALEDLFYGLITQTSPFMGDTREDMKKMLNIEDSIASIPSMISSSNENGHGIVTMMFKFDLGDISTNWMPLRMEGCSQIENIHPMIKSKYDAKEIIERVKARVLQMNQETISKEISTFFQFLGSVKKVEDRLIQRDLSNSPVCGKVDGEYGCMCPESPYGCVRKISFSTNPPTFGHIMLLPTVNRGRRYGPIPGVQIKPDRRKASNFVHVLSRFHVVSKTMNSNTKIPVKSSSTIRASSAHIGDANLSNLWKSVASTIREADEENDHEIMENVYTPDAILSSTIVNRVDVQHARGIGKHREIDSAYSIDTDLSFMDSKGNTITSNVFITLAVVKGNGSNGQDFPMTLKKEIPTLATTQKIAKKPPLPRARYPSIPKVKKTFNEAEFRTMVGWCKPMVNYVLRGALTPVAVQDAKNGSPWAKAFMAMVSGNKEEVVEICKGIKDAVDAIPDTNNKHMVRLVQMMKDKSNCASILLAVETKYGVDVTPNILKDVEVFM